MLPPFDALYVDQYHKSVLDQILADKHLLLHIGVKRAKQDINNAVNSNELLRAIRIQHSRGRVKLRHFVCLRCAPCRRVVAHPPKSL
jgi:hypothetical protein